MRAKAMSDRPNPQTESAGPTPTPPRAAVVYCGARPGGRPEYAAAADALGAGLAKRRIRLVYGAGDVGLMGHVARSCLDHGGDVLGFIPTGLWEREVRERGTGRRAILTETLQGRKAAMLANASLAIALPGGIGTLDEFVECLTWRDVGLHGKPLILVNEGRYWDPFLTLLRHMEAEKFVSAATLAMIDVVDAAEAALERADAILEAIGARS